MSKKFKDFSEEEKNIYRQNMRHSAAHVMAEAVTKIFPKAKVTLGPPIKDGFYYDFDVEKPFTPENLKEITKLMQKIINKNSLFVGREVSKYLSKKHDIIKSDIDTLDLKNSESTVAILIFRSVVPVLQSRPAPLQGPRHDLAAPAGRDLRGQVFHRYDVEHLRRARHRAESAVSKIPPRFRRRLPAERPAPTPPSG